MSDGPNAASSPQPPDEVTLRGMRFHALVGILPHEREVPQPLEIDLTAWAAASGIVIDYRGLYDAVASVVASGQLDYLETAGARIADGAIALPGVARVRVALRKPNVALPGPLAHAEVVVTRLRGG